MKAYISKVDCSDVYNNTKRSSPFLIVKYILNYTSTDKVIVDELLRKASLISKSVNPSAANGWTDRSAKIILADNIAGVVSEYFWKLFLNAPTDVVKETEYNTPREQIDLITNCGKTIEVRSSCPRKGVDFAICHALYQFDIIGPYTNRRYKNNESYKDFYVRTLFHLNNPSDIIEAITQNGFTIYLTGGATRDMMKSPNYHVIKSLKPNFSESIKTSEYIVVPFSKALDTFQIKALVRSELQEI